MMSNKAQWLALYSQPNADQTAVTPAPSMIGNRGMAYGDGFFTTMAVLGGAVLWSAYHRQRLVSHAQALQLAIDIDKILTEVRVQAEQLEQGIIKLIITRAEQPVRGYGFCADEKGSTCEVWLKSTAMVIETPRQLLLLNGNKVFIQPAISAICLTSQLACLPPTLAGLKSLNRLDNVLASGELQGINTQSTQNAQLDSASHQYGEGLVRDMGGAWVEGTMSNVFYQLDNTVDSKATASLNTNTVNTTNATDDSELSNYLTKSQWYTPAMDQSGVAGVMRQVIIDSLAATNKPVIVRSLTDDDLPHLSQLFFCNAVRGVMPASEITLLGGEVVELSL